MILYFNPQKYNLRATLAIFIACLALLGLATFIAEQRIKKIGIRKVLGARIHGIVQMLSKDFVKLIAIAFFSPPRLHGGQCIDGCRILLIV